MPNLYLKASLILFGFSLSLTTISSSKCSDLNENQCRKSFKCFSETRPSVCSKDVSGQELCTDDLRFEKCVPLSSEGLQRIEKLKLQKTSDKTMCIATGGDWKLREWQRFGICKCGGIKLWKKEKGCISFSEECTRAGGRFYPAGKLKCNDMLRKKLPAFCRKKYTFNSRFNSGDLCLCANNTSWRYNSESLKCAETIK